MIYFQNDSETPIIILRKKYCNFNMRRASLGEAPMQKQIGLDER